MDIVFCRGDNRVPNRVYPNKGNIVIQKIPHQTATDVFSKTNIHENKNKISFKGFFGFLNNAVQDCPKIEDFVAVDSDKKDTYYRYKNSKLAKDFAPLMNEKLRSQGISTIPYIGDMYIKGDEKIPLGTSGVGNCAVACFYNAKTKEQILYHVAPIRAEAILRNIKKIVPDGFDKVSIIPGCNPQTAETAVKIFDVVKKHNKKAQIDFRHLPEGKHNEIVFYKGEIYNYSKNDDKALFTVCNHPRNQFLV